MKFEKREYLDGRITVYFGDTIFLHSGLQQGIFRKKEKPRLAGFLQIDAP